MNIDISVDIRDATRRLRGVEDQIPFASARAATTLAKTVQATETKALPDIFDKPTPFTMKAFGVKAARKTDLTAEVFAKDRQAAYLMPSEAGTPQYLGRGRKIRTPVDIGLNQYGNIPRRKIASLANKDGYFLGVIHGINALWKRKGRGHVELMVAFTNPVPIKTRLHFHRRAELVVAANVRKVFGEALASAVETRK